MPAPRKHAQAPSAPTESPGQAELPGGALFIGVVLLAALVAAAKWCCDGADCAGWLQQHVMHGAERDGVPAATALVRAWVDEAEAGVKYGARTIYAARAASCPAFVGRVPALAAALSETDARGLNAVHQLLEQSHGRVNPAPLLLALLAVAPKLAAAHTLAGRSTLQYALHFGHVDSALPALLAALTPEQRAELTTRDAAWLREAVCFAQTYDGAAMLASEGGGLARDVARGDVCADRAGALPFLRAATAAPSPALAADQRCELAREFYGAYPRSADYADIAVLLDGEAGACAALFNATWATERLLWGCGRDSPHSRGCGDWAHPAAMPWLGARVVAALAGDTPPLALLEHAARNGHFNVVRVLAVLVTREQRWAEFMRHAGGEWCGAALTALVQPADAADAAVGAEPNRSHPADWPTLEAQLAALRAVPRRNCQQWEWECFDEIGESPCLGQFIVALGNTSLLLEHAFAGGRERARDFASALDRVETAALCTRDVLARAVARDAACDVDGFSGCARSRAMTTYLMGRCRASDVAGEIARAVDTW